MPIFSPTAHKQLSVWRTLLAAVIVATCFAILYFSKPPTGTPDVILPEQKVLGWSSTRDMSPDENAEHHFDKHGDEFGFKTKEVYLQAANDFVSSPPDGTLTVKQVDGDQVYFHPDKNWFAVVSYKGQIRTFYRLDPQIHGYKSNAEYFNAQAGRK